jgi:hypothetical protein
LLSDKLFVKLKEAQEEMADFKKKPSGPASSPDSKKVAAAELDLKEVAVSRATKAYQEKSTIVEELHQQRVTAAKQLQDVSLLAHTRCQLTQGSA